MLLCRPARGLRCGEVAHRNQDGGAAAGQVLPPPCKRTPPLTLGATLGRAGNTHPRAESTGRAPEQSGPGQGPEGSHQGIQREGQEVQPWGR